MQSANTTRSIIQQQLDDFETTYTEYADSIANLGLVELFTREVTSPYPDLTNSDTLYLVAVRK